MRAAVYGAGSWGTALSLTLARNGHEVVLVARDADSVSEIAGRRENLRYLPGFVLPKTVCVQLDPPDSCDVAVLAVPASAAVVAARSIPGEPVVAIASKGLDTETDGTLSDAIAAVRPRLRCVALSGPNLAVEVARGVPTVAVAAATDPSAAEAIRAAFMSPAYRIYVSEDLRGVELAGALKNVLAIAAGLSDGLGFGDNTKGALLARGLNEIATLGLKMGARLDTFLGIAGVGDLFATASSTLSRNYRLGQALAQGRSAPEAIESIGQVAEGVPTCKAALRAAAKLDVSMPISEATHGILIGKVSPRRAVEELMARTPKKEGAFPHDE